MGSLAGKRKSTLDTRVLFSMAKCSEMLEPITRHELFEIFKWSMDALATGKFPAVDHDGRLFSRDYEPKRFAMAGKDIAAGMVACFGEMRGIGSS